MRRARRTLPRLLAAVAVVAALAGCGSEVGEVAQGVDRVAEGVDTAQDCAAIVSDVTNINLNLDQANPSDVRQGVERLERTVEGIESTTLKDAADGLVAGLRDVADALERADVEAARQALRNAGDSAQEVAAACNIPVDRIWAELGAPQGEAGG